MSNCKTIAVCNQKGGVGKTTTTVNLGVGLAMQGKKVLLIDADPQGDLTTCLGWQDTDGLGITLATKLTDVINETMTDPMVGILHHEEGVDLVPANLELSAMEFNLVNAMSRETTLKNYLSQVKNRYDYVIIDCMPSLGMVTLNALSAADSVIIPVQAQYLPAKGMTQLVQTISKVKKYINPDIKIDGILLTLVDSRTNLATPKVDEIKPVKKESFKDVDTEPAKAVAYQKIPDKPVMTPEAAAYPKLKKMKAELDNQNNLIFQAEQQRGNLEIELSDLKRLAKITRKAELQRKIDEKTDYIKQLKIGLSNMVSRYGYENMNEFLLTLKESKAAYEIYQQAVDNWNKSSDQLEIVFDEAVTIYEKLAKLKEDTTHSQQYSYKQKKDRTR